MSGFGDRISERQKGFKKAVDADEARRKREDAAVQLRKQTKEEALLKKRMVDGAVEDASVVDPAMGGAEPTSTNGHVLEQLPALVQAVLSDDPEAVFNATQQFRKLLSIEQNPPIAEVINAGIVPRFVLLLREVSAPKLQFEAAWVLTNIASGTAEQTRVVVEHGALPLFVELLQSPDEDVREQAVWALGNISGDGPNYRDLVLQSGGLGAIMRLVSEACRESVIRNATWSLSNLCRGKPQPPLEWVAPALPTFANLICSSDVEVLTDAAWALSYLTDGSNDRISAVLATRIGDTGSSVCQRLVELMSHDSPLVQTPALRAVGNIVTGDDDQTQAVLQCGALVPMLSLLSHSKKSIRKECCWAISNVTAGSRSQIQEVINHGLIPPVLGLLGTADFDVRKEAAWAISNATAGGSAEQIEYLVEQGGIKPLCDLLVSSDGKIVGVVLDALSNILRVGQQKQQENGLSDNPVVSRIEQVDGLQKIEALQEDPNEEVYGKAVKLLETYFPLEDEDAGLEGAEPMQGKEGGFSFGGTVPQGGFSFGS